MKEELEQLYGVKIERSALPVQNEDGSFYSKNIWVCEKDGATIYDFTK